MKYKDVIKRQKAHGNMLREWMQERAEAAQKRNKERQRELNSRPRGVDQVPSNLKNLRVTPTVIVEHFDLNYAQRRAEHRATGRAFRPGTNLPHYSRARAERHEAKAAKRRAARTRR